MRTIRAARRKATGFTLPEVLIAMSITALIVVLLSRIFIATANQWQRADQRIDVFRDARAGLQIIARDLRSANIHASPMMLSLTDNAPSGAYAREAYMITPAANSGKSDLCTVGYYLDWSSVTKTFTLKRVFKDSDATTIGLQGTTLNLAGLFTKNPATDEDLAAYVWDLEFLPGELADPIPPSTHSPAEWKWIEVRFKAISPNAAQKIRNSAVTQTTWSEKPPDLSDIYRTLILPHEQQFVTRVMLYQNQ